MAAIRAPAVPWWAMPQMRWSECVRLALAASPAASQPRNSSRSRPTAMIACSAAECSADSPKPSRGPSRYSPVGERQPGVTIGEVSTPTNSRSRWESLSRPPFRAELEMPVGARRRWIGAAGIRAQRIKSVERRHGDCLTSTGPSRSNGDARSDARWGAPGADDPGPPQTRTDRACGGVPEGSPAAASVTTAPLSAAVGDEGDSTLLAGPAAMETRQAHIPARSRCSRLSRPTRALRGRT
jgi:hypothetical protein